MKFPAQALYLLLAVYLFGLIGLFGYHSSGLSHPTVLLETRPVDPRDLFRGDYVILNYVISQVPDKMNHDHLDGRTVYVTLKEQEDGFWEIAAIHRTHRKPIEGTVLRGQLSKGRITYDLEKFFVPEGQGNPPPPITVEVAVSPDGRGRIKTLFAEGEPWPRE